MGIKFAGKSDEAVKKATGKSWDEWISLLNSRKAKDMQHKDIAKMLYDEGHIKSHWWCQSVTVGYEEAIGRRVFGKREKGDFSVSIGKTVSGSPDDVLNVWQRLVKNKKEFNKVKIESNSRISSTSNWRYWKADLVDGSKLSVNIGPKTDKQSTLSVTLDKLKNEKAAEKWRKYWKEFLEKL